MSECPMGCGGRVEHGVCDCGAFFDDWTQEWMDEIPCDAMFRCQTLRLTIPSRPAEIVIVEVAA